LATIREVQVVLQYLNVRNHVTVEEDVLEGWGRCIDIDSTSAGDHDVPPVVRRRELLTLHSMDLKLSMYFCSANMSRPIICRLQVLYLYQKS
jgi:hypothetical protein